MSKGNDDRNIVHAFSERSADALRVALEIARRAAHTKCVVLHVYPPNSRFPDDRGDQQHRLEQDYARFLTRIDTQGVVVEPLFVEGGRVESQIERMASQQGVDLVVVLRDTGSPVGFAQALRERLQNPEEVHFS